MARIRLAHLSDLHPGPLPSVRKRDLIGKRITGYLNYRLNRSGKHEMELLGRIIADLVEQVPDHVCCTGDISNLGLAAEFRIAATLLDGLGGPSTVSLVPGNHDIYSGSSYRVMVDVLGPYMRGDATDATIFPFARRVGSALIVGLNSGIPSPVFMATGRLLQSQIDATAQLLRKAGEEGLLRIVMVHHAPYVGGSVQGRHLIDAEAFEAMLAECGAELILHGHNHVVSLAERPGPWGPVPILGAASASLRGLSTRSRASYFLIELDAALRRATIITRGLHEDDTIGEIERLDIALPMPPQAQPASRQAGGASHG